MALADYFATLTLSRKDDTDTLRPGIAIIGTIQGYIQQRGGSERITQNEYGENATYTLYTNVDADVRFGDRITKGSTVFTVVEPGEPDGVVSLGYHKEIGLRRVI